MARAARSGVYVMLDAVARPVDLVGDYTLTIVADSACTGIPNELQTRNWPASIGITSGSNAQPGTSLTLAVSGGSFLANQDRFPIGVSGGDVTFSVYSGEEVGLVEKIAAGTFLAIGGTASCRSTPVRLRRSRRHSREPSTTARCNRTPAGIISAIPARRQLTHTANRPDIS